MIRSTVSLILVAILLLGAAQASAGCGPFANTLYVGNTTSDNECDYDTIQAAIDAAVCPATIVITTQRTWSGQHLNITDKSLTLSGRASGGCGDVIDPGLAAPAMTTGTPPMQVSLTGYDDVDDSIIEITGNSHVTLRNLIIRGGRRYLAFTEGQGGGILFDGYGSLRLENVIVMDNSAGYGGGIYMSANGGHAELEIKANTAIHSNTAHYVGGGVAIVHDVHLLMVEAQTTIAYNTAHGLGPNGNLAGGEGGGLQVVGAKADIGSPGLVPGLYGTAYSAAIASNTAPRGGGIFVRGDGIDDGRLRTFSTGTSLPTALQGNSALSGGGLALTNQGDICLFNTNLLDNTAKYASAARIEGTGGLYVNVDPDGVCDLATLAALGARPCPTESKCNLFVGNDTEEAGSPTDDAVISIGSATFHAERLEMSANIARYGIKAINSSSTISLRNCLIADNGFSFHAVMLSGSASSIDHCTFANNGLDFSDTEIATDSDISLTRSIIHEPTDKFALDVSSSAANVQVHHVLSSDLSTLPVSTDVITGDPLFNNPAQGDYRLRINSPALDFAPGSEGKDLNFQPRKVDWPLETNDFGPGDLGAYELQLPAYTEDTLFRDGFEMVYGPT